MSSMSSFTTAGRPGNVRDNTYRRKLGVLESYALATCSLFPPRQTFLLLYAPMACNPNSRKLCIDPRVRFRSSQQQNEASPSLRLVIPYCFS
jgi:hypothetical protein